MPGRSCGSFSLSGEALRRISSPLFLIREAGAFRAETSGRGFLGTAPADEGAAPLAAYVMPVLPENLGDPDFCAELGIRFPYLGGSMAKGISSVDMAEELGRAGMLGFFGAAGLPLHEVEAALDRLRTSPEALPFGFNLIHSPQEPDLEEALAELYIRKGVRLIEASAFLALTLPLVRYRVHGIHRLPDGTIMLPNRIIAKVSREELAARVLFTATGKVSAGAGCQRRDHRGTGGTGRPDPAGPGCHRRGRFRRTYRQPSGHGPLSDHPLPGRTACKRSTATTCRLRVGLAGGISTPAAAAAAFAMGAAYIMTGSVNQACIESGTSDEVREMLAETRQADVTMAPAADMFEMGVTVQVLKRGTMFPMRAAKLYELYRLMPASRRSRPQNGKSWKKPCSRRRLRISGRKPAPIS